LASAQFSQQVKKHEINCCR